MNMFRSAACFAVLISFAGAASSAAASTSTAYWPAGPAWPTAARADDPGERGTVAPWSDNFDSYATGSQLHGQGGWKGWFNDPAAGALLSDVQASSAPNSVAIVGPTDIVQPFSGYTSGVHVLTAKQFIPTGFTGESYFIVQNRYNDAGTDLSWSVQVIFSSALGTLANSTGAANPGSMPFVTDTWSDIALVIDLDANNQSFYYNGSLLYSGSWTAQFPPNGGSTPGTLTIGALDLFANGASVVYYDDIALSTDAIYSNGFDPQLK